MKKSIELGGVYPHLQEIIKTFILKSLTAISTFLFGLCVARFGEVEEAGRFFYVVATICFLGTVVRLGLDQYIVRTVSALHGHSKSEDISAIYSNGLLTLILLLSPLALWAVFYDEPVVHISNASLVLIVFLYAAIYFHSFFFQAVRILFWYQVFQGLGASSTFLFISTFIYLILGNVGFGLFLNAYLISHAAILALAVVMWARTGCGLRFKTLKLPQSFKMIKDAVVWLPPMLMFIVFGWFGQIMLGIFSSDSEVALYSISIQVSMLIYLIPMSINAYSMPNYAKYLHQEGGENLRKFFSFVVLVSFSFTLPLALLVLYFSDFLLAMFGHNYSDASNIVRILVISQIFNVIGSSSFSLLVILGHHKAVTIASLSAVVFIFITTVFTIPILNGEKVGLAYAGGMTIYSFISLYFVFAYFSKCRYEQLQSAVN